MKKYFIFIGVIFSLMVITGFIIKEKNVITKKFVINILPTGNIPDKDISFVKNKLQKFYKCEVNVLPNDVILEKYKVKGMNRYQAVPILENFNLKYENVEGKIVVITYKDICVDRKLNGKINKNWGIFGLSLLGGKTCIVSVYRFKRNYYGKLEKVSIHELGHSLGIPHCDRDIKCIMNDAKGKGSTVDNVSLWMCDKCKNTIKY